MHLSDVSIHAWLQEHGIKNEKGEPISFRDHMFLFDIYRDLSPLQCIMKAAQIGASTAFSIKPFWLMEKMGMDAVYTLPTDSDVADFVGGKTNRIIAQNPVLQKMTEDRDTIEQKHVGKHIIYYRGTFTKKKAMMVSADLLIHDEVDASKQEIVEDYQARLKHSKYKWRWYFSHPSTEGVGVHKYWLQSDQKHWFVKCSGCNKRQFLDWPDSIDPVRQCYQCKYCGKEITDQQRREGEWVQKERDKEFSGYWVPSLVCPWVPAKEILKSYTNDEEEYFTTKVLGLPYVGGGNKVLEQHIMQNLTDEVNTQEGRIVIGVDTGVAIRYVCGNNQGLFYYGECKDYEELDGLLRRWPRSVMVIDQGGDIIGSRKLREKYPGRVFLCYYSQDRSAMQIIRWGEGDEAGRVIADRNRLMQLVIDEFTDKRIPISGVYNDWYDYWLHWSHIYRVKEENNLGVTTCRWQRSDRDDWVHATCYWRAGMDRFGGGDGGSFVRPNLQWKEAPEISIAGRMTPPSVFRPKKKDWRN